jgi:hypothetical protein
MIPWQLAAGVALVLAAPWAWPYNPHTPPWRPLLSTLMSTTGGYLFGYLAGLIS